MRRRRGDRRRAVFIDIDACNITVRLLRQVIRGERRGCGKDMTLWVSMDTAGLKRFGEKISRIVCKYGKRRLARKGKCTTEQRTVRWCRAKEGNVRGQGSTDDSRCRKPNLSYQYLFDRVKNYRCLPHFESCIPLYIPYSYPSSLHQLDSLTAGTALHTVLRSTVWVFNYPVSARFLLIVALDFCTYRPYFFFSCFDICFSNLIVFEQCELSYPVVLRCSFEYKTSIEGPSKSL
jgi:hypothetical protein